MSSSHMNDSHLNRCARFSGDTMPTDNLVFGGKNVTLLIHEATMGEDQAALAKKKAHSTIGQAIDIGKRCVRMLP